jgi:hypothetical protein
MIDSIDKDLKSAMLARDNLKVSVLRGIKSSIKNEEIKKRQPLTDNELIAVLRREVKQREESALVYDTTGLMDKAQQEREEKKIIEAYLPPQMDESVLKELIEDVVKDLGDDASKTGQIIGEVIAKAQGQTDGATVARLIKERFSK